VLLSALATTSAIHELTILCAYKNYQLYNLWFARHPGLSSSGGGGTPRLVVMTNSLVQKIQLFATHS
jgi:hypothetical protein